MRHLIIPLLCLAAIPAAWAQDTTPAQQTSTEPAAGAPFKKAVYQDPHTAEKITLTGSDALTDEADGKTRTGKYSIEGSKMRVVFDSADASGDPRTLRHTYNIVDNGLQDDEYGQTLLNEAALKSREVEILWLSNAKQIALACRLYASDNNGNFPAKLGDLIPTYLEDGKLFVSPLSTKGEAMGYEYFGAGHNDSEDPSKVFLRSKDTTPDGRRIIVYFDSSGAVKADK